jgi:hypothetical protein
LAEQEFKGKLLEVIDLPNGLRLEFWDESRPIAGDRWYVGLRALVPVPIPETSEKSEQTIFLLKEALGKEACYQHLMERHFIPWEGVPSVLGEMKKSFLANSLSYLSHPEFPKRFLLSKARELEKRRAWGAEYAQKTVQELLRPHGLEKALN